MEKKQLMDHISDASIQQIIPCFNPLYKNYKKGEAILSYEASEPHSLAVLMKGAAKLEIYNEDGDDFFLESYMEGDVFGDLFSLPLESFAYIVTAETDCVVMYLDYEHIITPCEHRCDHHSQLISNLFVMTAQKSQELALRLSIMNQTSTRSKLMTYLRHIRQASGGAAEFTIPMSLAQLADYIRVDRSSMMREIKAMKEDGLIDSKSRRFTILS